jgi:hypothetical protein
MKIFENIKRWDRKRKRKHRRLKRQAELQDKDQLCVMGIFKNEELGIDEWIEHYLWQGATKVFVIDNGSSDGTLGKAQHYTKRGLAETISLPEPHKQLKHYRTAYKFFNIQKRFRWLYIADSDEFLFCKNGDPLNFALYDYEDVKAIYINGRIFGHGGHKAHPKSLRKELVWRSETLQENRSTKWIAMTSCLGGGRNIGLHKVHGGNMTRVVSDNLRFQLNHYVTQSEHYWFNVKIPRGDAVSNQHHQKRGSDLFNLIAARSLVKDTTLADLVGKELTSGNPRTGLVDPFWEPPDDAP